ncbi:MAG: glycosyltransferase family 4 protein [Acidobacteria bacterium]|nr:glycosyltransferase family 4 protein [Acidobacteriota bacterium]MCL5288140.1 glycosyltransferase family 4 protein [Acidobacteriota bacterium]
MRIGVDATCWTNRRGYGRFARALLTAALAADPAKDYTFFVDTESEEFPLPDGVEIVRVAADVPTVKAAAADGSRSLSDMWAMSRAISARKLDVFFFPSVYSYVLLTSSVPELTTIHDVIPERFPKMVFPTLRSKLFWRAKVFAACGRAHLVLTVSEYSRRCIAETLRIPPARLRVVNEAGDPAFRHVPGLDTQPLWNRLGVQPGTRLLAYVGGFSPHKNLIGLVSYFAAAFRSEQFADVKLVLVGDFESDPFFSCYSELQKQIQKYQLQDRVLFPGYMQDDDLRALFHVCTALVLPSMCEGFGLPAVEAAACGAPAVVTTESPLPEILGEGAIALRPDDFQGWVDALTRVVADDTLRKKMSAAGLAATAKLSWENSARQLLAIFDEVREKRVAST